MTRGKQTCGRAERKNQQGQALLAIVTQTLAERAKEEIGMAGSGFVKIFAILTTSTITFGFARLRSQVSLVGLLVKEE